MTDGLLQKLGQIIYSYYQLRGQGLEKTCLDVISCFEESTESVLNSTNVFRLSETGLDNIQLRRDDKLLVG